MSELPIELRGVSANLVDRVEPNALAPVGPSMLSSTPGLAGAAVTGAPFAPGPSIEDPQALQLGLARVAGEHFGMPTLPTTIVPTTIAPSTSPQTFGGAPTFAPSIPDSPSGFDLDAIALAMLPPGIAPNHGPISTAAVPRSGASNEASGYSNAPPPATPPTNVLDRGLAHATPGISPELVTPEAPGFSPTLVPMVDNTALPFGSAASPGQARLVDNTALPFGSAASPGQARLVDNVPMTDTAVGSLPHGTTPPIGGGTGAWFSPPNSPAIEYVPLVGDSQPSPQVTRSDRVPLIDNRAGAFDPHVVRRDFPILDQRVNGRRLVWLDNGATTQKPRAVIDRLSKFYERENSNVHRGAHTLAARATDAYESARETTRKFLNASSTSEIVFVRGATEGINLVAKSWGQRYLERGDEIIVTHLEHHANIVPWQQLCQLTGARLRVAPVDDRGDVILEEYERLMCSRTKLVSFTHVSNALGTITPAREMTEIAHRWGATVIIDGAQGVSHMPVDVQALDCEFYIFSGHKVFAPTGIGAVYGKRDVLEATPPWQGGGNMIQDVTFERTVYQPPPWRFEAGTGNIADAAGMGAALDYVMRLGMPTIERYEHDLLLYGLERLATVRGLHMIGNPRNRAGVMSFVLDGQRTEDVGGKLDKYGIAVRSGHHCAQPILRRFGVEASVRASLAFYNVPEDIDALVHALQEIQSA
jgi:cysteine desulfurase / selenocysteine lyase